MAAPSWSACSTRCSWRSIGIVFATMLGFVIGVARLSPNWLVRKLARRLCRGDPQHPAAAAAAVLVQRRAEGAAGSARQHHDPRRHLPQQSRPVSCPSRWRRSLFAYVLSPSASPHRAGLCLLALARRQARMRHGPDPAQGPRRGSASSSACRCWPSSLAGFPLTFDMPQAGPLQHHRRHAGLSRSSWPCCSGLSIYTAAFIAEIVRAGILAVSHGQTEAAAALGLAAGPDAAAGHRAAGACASSSRR